MKIVSEEDLGYLNSFIKTMRPLPSSNNNRLVDFETQVKDAVYKFEDLINRQVSADRTILSGSESDQSFKLVLSQELLKVKQEISSFRKTLKTRKHYYSREEDQQQLQQLQQQQLQELKQKKTWHSFVSSERMIVLLDNEPNELRDWIFSRVTKRDVVSIVGMAGVGKTTLVEQVYYNPLVAGRFKHCLFLPVGPHGQLKEIMLLALDQLGVQENAGGYPLSNYVYKTLIGTDPTRCRKIWETWVVLMDLGRSNVYLDFPMHRSS